ncbi:hypothetical protein LOK49_LG01G02722 [Camellia lanceoleosa]|uniref:Uncharacterized protein n=1 Tax=Camellia lanceoleosa TaxID=1840588 RepID=A0ACC0IYV3_9ERIC|nr:hypothetical protein LOK49_LG01G02722 [Camellia lanceoleosa]
MTNLSFHDLVYWFCKVVNTAISRIYPWKWVFALMWKIEVQWSGRKLRYRWNLSSKLGKADGFPDMILILASQIVNFPP